MPCVSPFLRQICAAALSSTPSRIKGIALIFGAMLTSSPLFQKHPLVAALVQLQQRLEACHRSGLQAQVAGLPAGGDDHETVSRLQSQQTFVAADLGHLQVSVEHGSAAD